MWTRTLRLLLIRRLQWFHRWAGTATAFVVAVWFFSGIVMIFFRYPSFDRSEKLENLTPLKVHRSTRSPAELDRLGIHLPEDATLQSSLQGEAIYVFTEGSRRRGVLAKSGQDILWVDRNKVMAFARDKWPEETPRWEGLHEESDLWTIHPRFSAFFPLHLISVGDNDGSQLYVSSRTGEIVQWTTQSERFWAYLGAIPHWIYFTPIRRHGQVWRWLVIVISSLAMFVVTAGWILGVYRIAKTWIHTYRSCIKGEQRLASKMQFVTPFKSWWFRWHHLFGTIFGVFIASWLLSGALSLSPFDWSQPTAEEKKSQAIAWRGGNFDPQNFSESLFVLVSECRRSGSSPVSIELRQLQGRGIYLCNTKNNSRLIWRDGEELQVEAQFPITLLESAFRALRPDRNAKIDLLPEGDAYEFQRRHDSKRESLIRATWSEPSVLRIYVDRSRVNIVASYNCRQEWERWLYHGLHSLDWRALYDRPWLWMTVMMILLLGGLGTSVTATKLSLRSFQRVVFWWR